jgi:hypothetical protein
MPEDKTTPLERLMRRLGVPVTRESYLDLDYAGQAPEELSAEQEMDLPDRLRKLHDGQPAKPVIKTDLVAAHRHGARHRAEVLASDRCGCFYCSAVFSPTAITRWTDGGETAICPFCGVDAIIGDQSGYPVTSSKWLERMKAHWFRSSRT